MEDILGLGRKGVKNENKGLIILSFTRILVFQIEEDSVDSPCGWLSNLWSLFGSLL